MLMRYLRLSSDDSFPAPDLPAVRGTMPSRNLCWHTNIARVSHLLQSGWRTDELADRADWTIF
ncbi:hypothetical protein A5647_06820 [Mycobacterium sp. 1100029.7]|nr:hypothetical protein A5647_06820 [Mycobacterium sp. 1100029.7]